MTSRLYASARRAEVTNGYDGVTGQYVGRFQTSEFMETSSFGSTSEKRVISTAPITDIPDHHVLTLLAERHLLGGRTLDECQGSVIRHVYWTRKVLAAFMPLTPGQLLSDATAPVEYGQAVFLQTTSDPAKSVASDRWLVYLRDTFTSEEGAILLDTYSDTLYRVRSSRVDVDRFCTVECDRVDFPVDCTLHISSAYNPVTDTNTVSDVPAKILFIDYYAAYAQESKAAPVFEAGDRYAVTTVNTSSGDTLSSPYGLYRVMAVSDHFDAKLLHLRRC